LCIAFACGTFPYEYIPMVFDNYQVVLTVENQLVEVELRDNGGGGNLI